MLPADKGQVGAFSDKIQFSGEFTSDRDDLVAALRDLQFGNPTRLYDAIDASIDIMDEDEVEGRKIVLIFTDGDDTASKKGMGDVLDKAKTTETMIYAIGLESEFPIAPGRMQRTRPDRGLRRLADETGGGYFELKKTTELAPTFTRVAAELHSLYTIGFNPTLLDNKEHRLDVRMKQAGHAGRARKSYIASADRLSGGNRADQGMLNAQCSTSIDLMTALTEQDFRLEADRALERLQHSLLPLADEHGFEVELQNGVLQIVFEDPSPAKFVVSPNAPVRQIWVSAMSRSYKLTWQPESSTFALDSESLDALIERLARQFIGDV